MTNFGNILANSEYIFLFIYRLSYQGLHHVGFAVAESFDSIEDVHHILVLDHLKENVAGTEGPTATTTVTAAETVLVNAILNKCLIFSCFIYFSYNTSATLHRCVWIAIIVLYSHSPVTGTTFEQTEH